jgi:YVTN family beta-propeller protein
MPRMYVFAVHRRLARYLPIIGATCAALVAVTLFLSASTAVARAATGPKAYIGVFGNNTVAVFDSANNQLLSTIRVPAGPHGVVGLTPHGLAMTPDGSQVLVAGFGTNRVSAIDTATNEVTWSVPVASPHNIAITPDGQTAYVGSQDPASPSLEVLSLADQALTDSVPLSNVPRALTVSPDGTRLWFTVAGMDSVLVLDTATNDIVGTIRVGASPHYPAFTPDGALGMVVAQGPGELWLLDPATDASTATVKVGDLPHWIAVSPDGLTAYVTNENSNNLSVVDLTTSSVTATVRVGAAPRQIALQSSPVGTVPSATPVAQPTSTAPTAPPQTVLGVGINQFAFDPQAMTIATGQSVTWTNMDPVQHTTTSDNPNWDSGALNQGASFSHGFDMPGTYTYHCNIHPFMHGTVVVTT